MSDDYRIQHTAPERGEYYAPLWDLQSLVPDVYKHPEWHRDGNDWDRANEALVLALEGEPDKPVTIYRSVPVGVSEINPGDWVTLCREYAVQHGMHHNDPEQDLPVISATVPARHVWWDGNSLYEFGYDPREGK